MKNLLVKEFKLALHPVNIIFIPLSAMVLIPNYPYYVIFFYTCLGIFFICQFGRENNDVYYTITLPVKKSDVVGARIIFACVLELIQIFVTAAFAVLRSLLPFSENAAGMEANTAFFGMSFLMIGLFNLVFFSEYYKDVTKVGWPFLKGSIVVFLYIAVSETLCHIVPLFKQCLDTPEPQFISVKAVLLISGIIIWSVLSFVTYRICVPRFEKQDI